MRQIIFDFGRLSIMDWQFMLRIYGYGLMLVLGFLLSIGLAKWRARRMGEDTDAITYCGILSLVGGVAGARIAYIIQKWPEFSNAPNPLVSMLDITSGGLIYYGGLILGALMVVTYLVVKHLPLRRYLDILAPSIMLGLAFGRMGCLLNGCCFGGVAAHDSPFAMTFPMYSQPLVKIDGRDNPFSQGTLSPSPPYQHQLDGGLIMPDERLLAQVGPATGRLHAPKYLHGPLANDQLAVVMGTREAAQPLFAAIADRGRIGQPQWDKALGQGTGLLRGSEFWNEAVEFASFHQGGRGTMNFDDVWGYLQARRQWLIQKFDANEDGVLGANERQLANEYLQFDLIAIASAERSLPVKPSQALGVVNALLLAVLLIGFHRLRSREGQTFALVLVLYPITRFFEELIRDDNVHNIARLELTHNQYTSILMLVIGIIMLLVLRKLSPNAGPDLAGRRQLSAALSDRKPSRRS